MNAPLACPRQFEAEALRDGRLSGVEEERFRAHARGCADCAREVQSLSELGEALRAPLRGSDELHVRRERTRLLASFDDSLKPAAPRRALWVGAAALTVCAALVLAFWRLGAEPARHMARPAPRAEVPSEVVQVRADSSARWSRHSEPQLERVMLESGALSIHVAHGASPRRLIVSLPDGELEDIGTTFLVSAHEGRTTRVIVQEGSVVLRLRGQGAIALGAGETWTPAPAALPSATNAAPTPKSAASARSAAPATSLPDASSDFRAAMAALSGGEPGRAAELFRAFASAHPGDARAEDAAYLRALAFQRAGSHSAAQNAANEYLRRYPSGFRRAEAEQLAR